MGVGIFCIVVARSVRLGILKEIWRISESLIFVYKVGGCSISERLQDILHEGLQELVSNKNG